MSRFRGKHVFRKRRLNNIFDITKETALLEEIKDIRDEIDMILMILKDQRAVFQTSKSEMKGPSEKASDQHVAGVGFIDRYQMVDMNIKDFEKMEEHAKRTHNAVCFTHWEAVLADIFS